MFMQNSHFLVGKKSCQRSWSSSGHFCRSCQLRTTTTSGGASIFLHHRFKGLRVKSALHFVLCCPPSPFYWERRVLGQLYCQFNVITEDTEASDQTYDLSVEQLAMSREYLPQQFNGHRTTLTGSSKEFQQCKLTVSELDSISNRVCKYSSAVSLS